jgi:hypothetical protein
MGVGGGYGGGVYQKPALSPLAPAMPGQIAGRVVDATGAALPGATVTIESGGRKQTLFTATDGSYVANVGSGPVTVTGELAGFKQARRADVQTGSQADLTLEVGSVTESVNVSAQAPSNTGGTNVMVMRNNTDTSQRSVAKVVENQAPSVNMQNLQRRAAGVLPIRMDVPRAGTSHRFVRPLVIDEETVVTFRYKKTR